MTTTHHARYGSGLAEVWTGSDWERMEDRIKQLEEQLAKAEHALERSERRAVASQYASAMMHEVNNPVEAITNLIYLTKIQSDEPEQVLENMGMIEDQPRAGTSFGFDVGNAPKG